jgi:phage baseplate assembly protein W|tara:strand:+ start:17 stop:460 length:444 start_codon:yes stop_codon:yes gene_type:complete
MATRTFSNSPYNLEGGGKVSARSTAYSDLDFTFLAKPGTGDLYVKTDAAAIKQSVYNLVMTNVSERPFQPHLGTNITAMLFENLDVATAMTIERHIRHTLGEYEPRIEVVDVLVTEDGANTLRAQLTYQIISSAEIVESIISMERIR